MPALSGSTIGQLKVVVGADTSGLSKGLAQARSGLQGLSRVAGIASKAVAALGIVGGGATLSGLMAMSAGTLRAMDATGKMADQIGIATEQLGGLRHAAASMAGLAEDRFDNALRRMTRRLADAADGSGAAASALDKLGISAQDIARLSPDQQIRAIAEAMQGIGDQGQRLKIAFDVFGREGQTMVNMLAQGAAGLDKMQAEAERLGIALDRNAINRAQQATDAMDALQNAFTGVRNRIAIAVAPALTVLAQSFAEDLAPAADSSKIAIVDWGETIESVIGFAVDSARSGALIISDTFQRLGADIGAMAAMLRQFLPGGGGMAGVRAINEALGETKDALNQRLANFDARRTRDFASSGAASSRSGFAVADRSVGGGGGAASKAETKQIEDDLQRRLEAVQRFTATEQEIRDQAYLERMKTLQEANDRDLITNGEYFQNMLRITEKFTEDMTEAENKQYKESQDRLNELHELGIIGDADYKDTLLARQEDHEQELTNLMVEGFNQRLEILEQLRANGELTDEEYRQRTIELEQAMQDEITLITARGAEERNKLAVDEAKQRQATMQSMMNNLTQLMNSGSRAMFQIGKVAAVANAVLKGREAIVSSYAAGAKIGGPPLGAAFAATAAAATAAQIASVMNTSFGGGGGAATTGGSGSVARPTDAISNDPEPVGARRNTAVTINLQGEVFGRQQVRDLIDEINDAVADGATLRLA